MSGLRGMDDIPVEWTGTATPGPQHADGGAGVRTARELAAEAKASERPEAKVTKLVQCRLNLRLTLPEVAKEVQTTKSHLWTVEQGKSQPGVYLALRLARFYETTVEQLFGEEA
jgi:DNA-binding XRE family transcriptional regulator